MTRLTDFRQAPMRTSVQILLLIVIATVVAVVGFTAATAVLV